MARISVPEHDRLPSPEARRDTLRAVLAGEGFERSPRARDLLTYLVEAQIDARAVTAYAIAFDLYDRDETFDPGTDPIVRVQMGRLRKLVAVHGAPEGQPLRLDLQPRSYEPEWHVRRGPDRGTRPRRTARTRADDIAAPAGNPVRPRRGLHRRAGRRGLPLPHALRRGRRGAAGPRRPALRHRGPAGGGRVPRRGPAARGRHRPVAVPDRPRPDRRGTRRPQAHQRRRAPRPDRHRGRLHPHGQRRRNPGGRHLRHPSRERRRRPPRLADPRHRLRDPAGLRRRAGHHRRPRLQRGGPPPRPRRPRSPAPHRRARGHQGRARRLCLPAPLRALDAGRVQRPVRGRAGLPRRPARPRHRDLQHPLGRRLDDGAQH